MIGLHVVVGPRGATVPTTNWLITQGRDLSLFRVRVPPCHKGASQPSDLAKALFVTSTMANSLRYIKLSTESHVLNNEGARSRFSVRVHVLPQICCQARNATPSSPRGASLEAVQERLHTGL